MHPAVFLDRDGVIIENRKDHVLAWSEVEILPGSLEALARLSAGPYKIFIVTNQSAVGRGLISLEEAERINHQLVGVIEASGGRIDGLFMCPHAPEEGCACRKPEPGLLAEATRNATLDLKRSILIGDALSDLAAGRAAGVGNVALVRTGRGSAEEHLPEASELQPFSTYDTLADALGALLPEQTDEALE